MARGHILVTGASTGIGEAAALHLDRLGFGVFAGVRRQADGESLRAKGSERITAVLLDVTDAAQIAAAAERIGNVVGADGLHGLVNNAGIAVAGPLEFLPVDELRRQFEVNVIGLVAVTQAVLPHLRQAQGRIVNIGSLSGRVTSPMVGAYAASKHALEAVTASLRMELSSWGIHVSLVGPGVIATPIWEKSIIAASDLLERMPAQATLLYGDLIRAIRRRQENKGVTGLPAERVAEAVAHALTASRPKYRYAVGRDARMVELLRFLSPERYEALVLGRLRKLMGK